MNVRNKKLKLPSKRKRQGLFFNYNLKFFRDACLFDYFLNTIRKIIILKYYYVIMI